MNRYSKVIMLELDPQDNDYFRVVIGGHVQPNRWKAVEQLIRSDRFLTKLQGELHRYLHQRITPELKQAIVRTIDEVYQEVTLLN